MALWTPYLQETALDLSTKSAASRRISPSPHLRAPTCPYGAYIRPQPSISNYAGPVVKMERISPLHGTNIPVQQTPIYYGSYDPILGRQHDEYQLSSPYAGPAISPLLESSCDSWSHVKSNAPYPNILSPPESNENDSLSDDQEYLEFERESFQAMAAKNGGCILNNNPRMRRVMQTAEDTDDYRRQRNKNNIAAKQSRDRRKLREARLAVQCTFLKKKVAELKARLNKSVCARCAIS